MRYSAAEPKHNQYPLHGFGVFLSFNYGPYFNIIGRNTSSQDYLPVGSVVITLHWAASTFCNIFWAWECLLKLQSQCCSKDFVQFIRLYVNLLAFKFSYRRRGRWLRARWWRCQFVSGFDLQMDYPGSAWPLSARNGLAHHPFLIQPQCTLPSTIPICDYRLTDIRNIIKEYYYMMTSNWQTKI